MIFFYLIESHFVSGMSVYEQIASRTRARRHRKDQKLNEQVESVEEDEQEDDDEDDDRSSVVFQVSVKREKERLDKKTNFNALIFSIHHNIQIYHRFIIEI